MGLVAFEADETNAYVVGAGHSERTTIATEAQASSWGASSGSVSVPERNRSFAVASEISIPLLQPHVLMAWGSPFRFVASRFHLRRCLYCGDVSWRQRR
jgi:hypothetical protein